MHPATWIYMSSVRESTVLMGQRPLRYMRVFCICCRQNISRMTQPPSKTTRSCPRRQRRHPLSFQRLQQAAAKSVWVPGFAAGCCKVCLGARVFSRFDWAEARLKIARMTLTIKRDGNWSSFQLANSALPLSVTSSAIAPSARMLHRGWFSHCLNKVCLLCCSSLWGHFCSPTCVHLLLLAPFICASTT